MENVIHTVFVRMILFATACGGEKNHSYE